MIAQRTAHLARCFGAIALALGVPGLWAACSQSDEESPDAGEADASSPARDAASPLDSTAPILDASPRPPRDATTAADGTTDALQEAEAAEPISCWATVVSLDGGSDAEEICIMTIPCGLANATIALTAVGCQVLPALPDGGVDEAAAATFNVCELLPNQGCEDGGYVMPADGAPVVFTCVGCPSGGGRRPAGFRRCVARGATPVGAFVAELASLEAASVAAFDGLAAELAAYGAPRALVDAAHASAKDETRHARLMGRLAERFGGVIPAARTRHARPRSMAAIARENVVEGCIRETYGALVNAWQAAHAADPEVQKAMSRIARDELRHAALSWEIQGWVEALLSPSERRSVARAKRRAVASLVASTARGPEPEVRDLLGLPSEVDARALATGLVDRVWSAA